MSKIKCNIYRCSHRDEMYLYIHEDKTKEDLPDDLIKLVKELTFVMELELTPDRKLAREDVLKVMENLEEKGFHLQLPPDPLKPDLYNGD